MKTAIIALSAAALIAAAPAVFAHDASSAPKAHHEISKKVHPAVYGSRPEMQTTGWMRSYPGAVGYRPGGRIGSKEESNYSSGGGSGGGGGGGGGSGM